MNDLKDSELIFYTEVIRYIESLNLIENYKLNLNTSIENDLGITGDDALDFIDRFGKHFGISIEKFNYNKYFRPEGTNFLSFLFNWNTYKKSDDLKIRNLVIAVSKGILE